VVECARLEIWFRGNPNVGSNPTLSASTDYEAARSLFGRRAVARARWLGAHLEAQNTPREQRCEAALHQYPAQVPNEVGKQIAEIPELGTLAR
jgi:hypothetical protein